MTALEDTPVLPDLVRAGGVPFITLRLTDPETGRIELVTAGFTAEQVVAGLREAADSLAQHIEDEARERARQL